MLKFKKLPLVVNSLTLIALMLETVKVARVVSMKLSFIDFFFANNLVILIK